MTLRSKQMVGLFAVVLVIIVIIVVRRRQAAKSRVISTDPRDNTGSGIEDGSSEAINFNATSGAGSFSGAAMNPVIRGIDAFSINFSGTGQSYGTGSSGSSFSTYSSGVTAVPQKKNVTTGGMAQSGAGTPGGRYSGYNGRSAQPQTTSTSRTINSFFSVLKRRTSSSANAMN